MDYSDKIKFHKIENQNGTIAKFCNFGARLISFKFKDANSNITDVVLGNDEADEIVNGNPYFGATIGRYANRISNGKFKIADKEYILDQNNGPNALHGGENGYNAIFWEMSTKDNSVTFKHIDKDGHEGYPGNVSVEVKYTLSENDELIIDYSATSDQDTVINLTHHSFFNLNGADSGNILKHKLQIDSDRITELNVNQVTTGKFLAVDDSPFDFRDFRELGERIEEDHQQIKFGFGYDHNWVLNKEEGQLKKVASLIGDKSKIAFDLFTTEPGMQVYSGNFLDGSDIGREGKAYQRRDAVCLETQHFADSPNFNFFPSTLLKKGEKFESKTIYSFRIHN